MVKRIEIQWSYSPEEVLEQTYEYSHDNFTLKIYEGKARIIFENPDFKAEEIDRDMVEEKYKPYVLKALYALGMMIEDKINISSGFSKEQINDDGSKHVFVSPEPVSVSVSTSVAEVVIKDSEGNVIESSQERRINRRDNFVNKVLNYGIDDSTLQQLLISYNNSLLDLENEFFYLYEIREGIKGELGSSPCDVLNISSKKCSELGRISNAEPYKEGRHRGNFNLEELKPAPKSEKNKARKIARKMIEEYIEYLKNESR